jgi:isopenicillin N synthase-like dioxygenase
MPSIADRLLMKIWITILLSLFFIREGAAMEDQLSLDVISYEDFVQDAPQAIASLKSALHDKGIAGIKGIPGYREKVLEFIERARAFSALPEEIKEIYGRADGEMFLGYERGKERFQRADGSWVVDDLKVSYYGFIPDVVENKWPKEIDLKSSFIALGSVIKDVGEAVMHKIGLLAPNTGIYLDQPAQGLGRMLYYRKSTEGPADNPLWCGAHFDHGVFTALLPAFYFAEGQPIAEPREAGLFIRTKKEEDFKKIASEDPDVLLFQVGEFGQLAAHDAIRATEHCVRKAAGCVERYTMAFFFNPRMDAEIHSFSELATDSRYGAPVGGPCTYRHWNEGSFNRYLVGK